MNSRAPAPRRCRRRSAFGWPASATSTCCGAGSGRDRVLDLAAARRARAPPAPRRAARRRRGLGASRISSARISLCRWTHGSARRSSSVSSANSRSRRRQNEHAGKRLGHLKVAEVTFSRYPSPELAPACSANTAPITENTAASFAPVNIPAARTAARPAGTSASARRRRCASASADRGRRASSAGERGHDDREEADERDHHQLRQQPEPEPEHQQRRDDRDRDRLRGDQQRIERRADDAARSASGPPASSASAAGQQRSPGRSRPPSA